MSELSDEEIRLRLARARPPLSYNGVGLVLALGYAAVYGVEFWGTDASSKFWGYFWIFIALIVSAWTARDAASLDERLEGFGVFLTIVFVIPITIVMAGATTAAHLLF